MFILSLVIVCVVSKSMGMRRQVEGGEIQQILTDLLNEVYWEFQEQESATSHLSDRHAKLELLVRVASEWEPRMENVPVADRRSLAVRRAVGPYRDMLVELMEQNKQRLVDELTVEGQMRVKVKKLEFLKSVVDDAVVPPRRMGRRQGDDCIQGVDCFI